MSYLYQGSLILGRLSLDSTSLEFVNKDQVGYENWAVVGYQQLSGNTIGVNLSSTLCPGQQYVLKIAFPNSLEILYLAPLTTGTYTLLTGENPSALTVFEPLGIVYSGRSVNARLINPSVAPLESAYMVTVNSYYSLVGYTAQLPLFMSSCRACGCASGKRCTEYGVCISNQARQKCPSGSLCGQFNGRCSGFCADGYSCQQINGKYQCYPEGGVMNPWWLAWTIVLAIILAVFLVMLVVVLVK